VAAYAQFLKAVAKPGAVPKRITWLCGDPVLAREAVTRIRELVAPRSYHPVTAGRHIPDSDIWDVCAQLPGPDQEPRLVVVRSAQKLRDFTVLGEIASEGAGSWLVLVSDEPGFYKLGRYGKAATDNMGSKSMLPGPAAVRRLSAGQIVQCSLTSQDALVAWVQLQLPGLPQTVAWRAVERCGEDLAELASLCRFLALWPPQARTEALVSALVVPAEAQEFVDSLVTGRKAAAMARIPESEELGGVLGLLGSLLDPLTGLYSASLQQLTLRECVQGGIPQIWASKYRAAGRHYDPARVLACRKLLAEADSAWRSGAGDGVAEVVCALW